MFGASQRERHHHVEHRSDQRDTEKHERLHALRAHPLLGDWYAQQQHAVTTADACIDGRECRNHIHPAVGGHALTLKAQHQIAAHQPRQRGGGGLAGVALLAAQFERVGQHLPAARVVQAPADERKVLIKRTDRAAQRVRLGMLRDRVGRCAVEFGDVAPDARAQLSHGRTRETGAVHFDCVDQARLADISIGEARQQRAGDHHGERGDGEVA